MSAVSKIVNQFNLYIQELMLKIPDLVVGSIVVLLINFVLRFIRSRVVSYIRNRAEDKLLGDFANSFLHLVNITLLILLFLYIVGLGNIAGSIMGAAGISAFVIGFALKDIGENFLAGVVMAFDRPFRLGDTIETGSVIGVINKISLRDTHVRTFDGKDVFVPNGQIIKHPLYNYTLDGLLRQNFTVGVDYGSDLELARSVIRETVKSIDGVLGSPSPVKTHVKNLNSSTVDVECLFWINTFNKKTSGSEIKSIAQSNSIKALRESGISMPADVLEIKNYDSAFKTNSDLR